MHPWLDQQCPKVQSPLEWDECRACVLTLCDVPYGRPAAERTPAPFSSRLSSAEAGAERGLLAAGPRSAPAAAGAAGGRRAVGTAAVLRQPEPALEWRADRRRALGRERRLGAGAAAQRAARALAQASPRAAPQGHSEKDWARSAGTEEEGRTERTGEEKARGQAFLLPRARQRAGKQRNEKKKKKKKKKEKKKKKKKKAEEEEEEEESMKVVALL